MNKKIKGGKVVKRQKSDDSYPGKLCVTTTFNP